MLEAALSHARQHGSAAILAFGNQHVENLVRMLLSLAYNETPTIARSPSATLVSGDGWEVSLLKDSYNFDWRELRQAASPAKVFIDHFTIELHFAKMLHELHRYD